MAEVIVWSILHLGAAAAGVVNPDQVKFQQYQNVNCHELDRLLYISSPDASISSTSTHSPSSPAPNSPPAQTYALPSPSPPLPLPFPQTHNPPSPSRLALPPHSSGTSTTGPRPLTHRHAAPPSKPYPPPKFPIRNPHYLLLLLRNHLRQRRPPSLPPRHHRRRPPHLPHRMLRSPS